MKGLYVHIPFCIKKCKYCDFNSFPFSQKDKDAYLDALFTQMESYKGTQCDSVFIGGGTPTCLESCELEALTGHINKCFSLTDDCEFTVEANPGTIDSEKLDVLQRGGVNRLSVGVQSFNDEELKAIGRIHTSREAEDAIHLAHGFKNVSLDLMSALPGQSMESFKKNLEKAVSLNPQHISCYSLIIEENTPLSCEYKKNLLTLPGEECERDMYEYACKMLEENGYFQYEISNFAKPGFRSRHNLKYWNCEEYIGVGLSAHSYTDGRRFSCTDNFNDYISGKFLSDESVTLSENDKMSEFMFMGLRKTDGVKKEEFRRRFSVNIENIFPDAVLKYKKMGMLIDENGSLRLSHKAISVSNRIMCEFIL